MVDAVLLDLFGVIAREQSNQAKHTLTTIADVPDRAFWDAYWRLRAPYDRGQVSGAAYWRQVGTEVGAVFDDDRVGALIAADVESWNTLDDDVVDLVERAAAAGVRLALLSNIPEELAAHYERHHGRWLRHLELVAFSCRIGRAKPDPEIYRWCCHALGLAPQRVLAVDDRADNIRAAERLGLRTHLFTGPAPMARAIGAARPRHAAGG